MNYYTAYGLTIDSVLTFPELVAVDGVSPQEVNVRIRRGTLPPITEDAPTDTLRHVVASRDKILLRWNDVGTFCVHGGREIIIDPLPDVAEPVLRLFVLGTTLALLLHQRREMAVFHASVVAIDDAAVAFVGPKEVGKSTMAAALHSLGHKLVADDALAVDLREDPPLVIPGFPYMKLWPETVAAIGADPESLPRLRAEFDKRGYRVQTPDLPPRLPLKAVYLLGFGAELSIKRLTGKEAMVTLMPHWYGARLGPEVLRVLGQDTHFRECAGLSQKVPVFDLQRPSALQSLPDVANQLVVHLDTI